jgi:class 3 adenylate cyclase
MTEERKLVTVLFADIVGSTAMTGEHDAELVRGTLDRAFDRVSPVVAAHGGTVEKFIGDAVMAVFGVPAAHDDDAQRAVRAAFQIREIVRGATGRIPLDVRIGVNTGEAVARTDASDQRLVTGVAVNLAQRLQAAAEPGEIVVGEVTEQLTRSSIRYGAPRRVQAKGIGEIAAYTAELLLDALPEQHRGIEGLRAPLIGRDEEMTLLLDSLGRARTETRPHLVTVFGAAGAGKSRLTEEFMARVADATVRHGRCLPYGEAIALWAIRQILRADAGIDPNDDLATARSRLRDAARRAFADAPEDAEQVGVRLEVLAGVALAKDTLPAVDPAEIPDELAWGLRRYLERRAVERPLVLVFEDIHWASAELLDLIENVAEWTKGAVFLLCLARPEFLDSRTGWGSGKVNATSIVLEPLTPEETRELVSRLLDVDALSEEVRRAVIERAEGNPFYAEELIRLLIDDGQIAHREGRWVAAGTAALRIPPTIQGLIAARLDAAPPEVKRVLQLGAVVGRSFPTTAIAVLNEGRAPAAADLRDALRRDLLVDVDERGVGGGRVYRFKHVLIRDVAYASVPKAERAVLHDRYGRWYEEALGDRRVDFVELIAHHAEQAFLLATEVALDGTRELAQRAFRMLHGAASAAWERGDRRPARDLWHRAAAAGEAGSVEATDRTEVAGHLALADVLLDGGEQAVARLREVLPAVRAIGPSVLLARLVQDLAWSDHSDALMEEAVGIAERVGDDELLVEMHADRAQLYQTLLDTGVDIAERAIEAALSVADRVGTLSARLTALRAAAMLDTGDGRLSKADGELDEAEGLARAAGV